MMSEAMEFHQSELDELESIGDDDSPSVTVSKTKKRRKKPHYYTDAEDIALLIEILQEKPPKKGAVDKWRAIFNRVNIPVKDYKAIQARFDLLLTAFKQEEKTAFRGSGLEEDFNEKTRLMTDIVSEMDDWEKTSKVSTKKNADDAIKRAHEIRNASLEGLRGTSSPEQDGGARKKKRQSYTANEFLDIIQKTEEADRQNKAAAVEFEKKRLDIMERELLLREENDRHRREMEKRKMDMEEKRLEAEAQKSEKELQERTLLLSILQQNFQK